MNTTEPELTNLDKTTTAAIHSVILVAEITGFFDRSFPDLAAVSPSRRPSDRSKGRAPNVPWSQGVTRYRRASSSSGPRPPRHTAPKCASALGHPPHATDDKINTERGQRRLCSDYCRFAIESLRPQATRCDRVSLGPWVSIAM